MSKARKEPLRTIQQNFDALVVHHLGAVDLGFEHQTLGIYEQMALSPFHFLAAIVTTLLSAYSGRLYRLAIYDAGARLRVSVQTNPNPLTQRGVHPLPGSIQTEFSEVVVDAAPGWEVVGKQTPRAAAPYDIEDGVNDLA